MASDKPPTKILPFERPRRFPADLDRLRAMLDDEETEFEEADLDDGLACAEAAIARGVPGGHEVKADFLSIRAYRTLSTGDTEAALAAWAAILAWHPTYLTAYVARADVLGKRGDHEAALAELDRFVELSPTDARGYLHRANFYKDRGDGERALANCRRVAQLDPTSFETHLNMAQLLAAKGDATGAARAYAKYAEQELGDAEDYGMRAFMFFLAGQEELALADYEASLALAPNDADTLAWRGLCRIRLNHRDAAIADFTRLISMRPSEARGFQRRGEALVSVGRHAEALADLDRAIALEGDERGAAHFARGQAQEALGDREAALSSYDTAIERNPSNVACRLRRFQIHRDAEDWARCQIDAEAMLAQAPDNVSILHAHARLCVRNDRRDDALAAYDRLIALDPGNARAYYERSERLVGKGDTMAAYADLDRAFELAPEDPEIRVSYGVKQAQRATTDEERSAAIQLMASTVKLDGDDHAACDLLAARLRQAGCHAEGIRYSTRAIELAPDNPEYFAERARCLRGGAPPRWIDRAGFEASVVAALADAERAIALSNDDEDVEPYRLRADLREEAGDLEGALADQTKMIEMAPDFIDAYADRARLRKLTGDMAGARADAARVAAMEEEVIAELGDLPIAREIARFNLDDV